MIGVFVKYLTNTDLGVWNQILLRNMIAGIIGLLLVPSAFNAFVGSNNRNRLIICFRSVAYVAAIYLFTLALKETTLANVGLIGAFPFVAIYGFVFFNEKATKIQIGLLCLALLGVAIVANARVEGFALGIGEIYAFTSSGFFGLMYILAKKTTGNIDTQQYAVLTQVITMPLIAAVAWSTDGFTNLTQEFSLEVAFLASGAAVFIILNMLTISSGMQRSNSTNANILLYSGAVFSVIASLVFFRDIPKLPEIIGGTIILGSCLLLVIQRPSPKAR